MSNFVDYEIHMVGTADALRAAVQVIATTVAKHGDGAKHGNWNWGGIPTIEDGYSDADFGFVSCRMQIQEICKGLIIVSKVFPEMKIFVNEQCTDGCVESRLNLIAKGKEKGLLESCNTPFYLEEFLAIFELRRRKDAESLAGIIGAMIRTCHAGDDYMALSLDTMAKEVTSVIKKNPALATDPQTLELLQTLCPMLQNLCGPDEDEYEGMRFKYAEGLETAFEAAALSLSTKKALKTAGKGKGRKCRPVSEASV
jgi:hypothetical protein